MCSKDTKKVLNPFRNNAVSTALMEYLGQELLELWHGCVVTPLTVSLGHDGLTRYLLVVITIFISSYQANA